ncbi:hypothetical protein DFH06DRAFT_527315 [Mycena polygramma]|nr:hypothetical protein DFH06DRAFT_527315 [Mycena polygramma]
MQAMDGVELEWKFLKVTYRLLKMAEKKEKDRPAPKVFVQEEDTPKVAATAPPKTAAPSATTKPPTRAGSSATSEPSLDYLDRIRTPAFATEASSPTTEPHTAPTPPSPPPQTAPDVVHSEPPNIPSELEALRTLYDAEVTQRTAAQAESAALRAELETTQRALELAESRLKILQLERDRPLWEAAKKKREESERAEEEERRRAAEVEESRRKMREFQESEKSGKGKGQKERKKAPPKPAEWRLILHEGAARLKKEEERRKAAELDEARCKIQRFEEQERAYERAAEEDRKTIRVRKQREMKEKKERERVEKEERERREEQERQTRAKEAQEQKEREERERKEQGVRAQQEKEERERRAKEQREKEEAERKKQEEAAHKAKEAREREKQGKAATQAEEALHALQQQDGKLRGTVPQDEKLRGTGPWTPVRALGRLKSQVEELDKLKFWKRRKASEVDNSPRKVSRTGAAPTESRLILHYQCAARAREAERRRVADVEESRQKMQQFEEQVRRRRREMEEKQRREKEEADRKAQIKFQREKRWKDATLAEEARCRKRDEKLRGTTAWTAARALTRLKLQIEEFDTTKFSETKPLTFRAIPWPVLTDPLELNVEQIDWGAVELFFGRVKIQLATNVAEYNRLVEKVHRIFHPDKWKSRGLLVTVMDDDLKIALEAAGNVVAQAMTPLWRRSRGYNT